MSEQHSPAPWHLGGPSPISGWCIFHKPFGLWDICDVREKADAMLIAAAPDLLIALSNLLGLARMGAAPIGDYKAALAVADAAIAKATGEGDAHP